MKCIDEVPVHGLKGLKVLVRAGLDLPLDAQGKVDDMFRLEKALPTLQYLKEAGARIIVICKIGRDPSDSLAQVAEAMKQYFPVSFVHDIAGPVARSAISSMQNGDCIMLENLQQDPREIANDDGFAQELASLGDIYVNDAFPSAHRSSASMVSITKHLPSYAGIQFRDEVRELSKALHPQKPALAIIGGAKFETKEPIIRALMGDYEHISVVGALANDVLRAQGNPVGTSRVSDKAPEQSVVSNPKIMGPVDVLVERADKQAQIKKPSDVAADDKIVDIGPDTVAQLAPIIAEAKFIIWNGPSGLYEDGYTTYSLAIADLISKSSAQKVIGGGNTIAVIQESGMDQKNLGFLSTGGGAMLEFLVKGTLPAIEALK